MKKFIFGTILFCTGCISTAIMSLVAPISSIMMGLSYNDSSCFLSYMSHYKLTPLFFIFVLISIIGLYFMISELINDVFSKKFKN